MDAPTNKHNPISNFKILLSKSQHLINIQLSELSVIQVEELYQYSYNQLLENHYINISSRITNSTYFTHYKSIQNSTNPDNNFLNASMPWILKKLITQIRISPNQISTPFGQLQISDTKLCPLCLNDNITWIHLLTHCRIIAANVTPPLDFYPPANLVEFYSKTIPNITTPIAWYLF